MRNQFQSQRYEYKYQIENSTALQIRNFLGSYLDLDEYGASMPNFSYPVHSLYFDSDRLDLFHSTINGDKNRYKLRARFYENRPGAPVFFEIKSRMNNTISKSRGGVLREAVPVVVSGSIPSREDFMSQDPSQIFAIEDFIRLAQGIGAKPQTHVYYLREAWLARHDNSVRVTMDRNVQSCVERSLELSPEMESPVWPFGNKVILELKFTNKFPNWFLELVRIFNLKQTGAAKYVDGLSSMQGEALEFPYYV